MKREQIKKGFCVECGGTYLSEWREPQFTDYYYSNFDNVHICTSIEDAEHKMSHATGQPNATRRIKEITMTTTIIEGDDVKIFQPADFAR